MALNIKEMKKFVMDNDIENQLYVSAKYLIRNKDFKLRIRGTNSYTDIKNINIGYPVSFKIKSNEELFAIFMALMGHESQHMLSSSITEMIKVIEEVKKDFKEKNINENITEKIGHFILNSLEDGRIENILVNNKKGFLKYMKYLNYKLYADCEIQNNELYDFLNSILVYTKTGLLPKWFNKYRNTKLETEINKIKGDIDEAIYAKTCKECMQIGYKIITKVKDYLADLIGEEDIDKDKLMKQGVFNSDNEKEFNNSNKNSSRINDVISDKKENKNTKNNKKDSGNKNNKENEHNKNGNINNNDGKSKLDKEEENNKDNNNNNSNDNNNNSNSNNSDNDNNSNNSNDNDSNYNNGNSNIDEAFDEAFDEVFDELKKDAQERLKNYRKNKELERKKEQKKAKKEAKFQLTDKDIKDIMDEVVDFVDLNIEKVEIDKYNQLSLPQSYKNKANKFRREVVEILEARKKPTRRNQKNGLLDTRNLHRFVAFNNDDIFIKKQKSREFSSVFYFLIDGSGSMCESNKWNYAMETMSILEEALKDILEIKIAIFNATSFTGITNHTIIKNYGEKIEQNLSYSGYKNEIVYPKGCNKDGLNIRVATKELEKRPEKQKVLFVLSDGLPTAYKDKDIAFEDVKQATKEARSKNIEVISIFFGDEGFRTKSFEKYKKMYEKNIVSTEPEKIFEKLIRILKDIFIN